MNISSYSFIDSRTSRSFTIKTMALDFFETRERFVASVFYQLTGAFYFG